MTCGNQQNVYKDIMVNNNKFIDENYFFIDSNNFLMTKSKVYGFALTEQYLYHNYIINDISRCNIVPKKDYGAYIVIKNDTDRINIYQDNIGCFGIYLYRQNGYWALSNSLWLMQEKLGEKELHLDIDYLVDFVCNRTRGWLDEKTPFQEILLLPADTWISINKRTGQLEFETKLWSEYRSIPLTDINAINDIVNRWINKWEGLIRFLYENNFPISVELSGGFDSRIVFALFVHSGIPLNYISVLSSEIKKEDFVIVKQISQAFNFELNKNIICKSTKCNSELTLDLYKNCNFCISKDYNPFYTEINDELAFHFGGQGGELLRGYYMSIDELLDRYIYTKEKWSLPYDFYGKVFTEASVYTQKKYGIAKVASQETVLRMYKIGHMRHHFGKTMAGTSITRNIRLAPLFDPLLLSIDNTASGTLTPDTLYVVLLRKLCQKLLNFPFDRYRHFSKEALKFGNNFKELSNESKYINSIGFKSSYHIHALPRRNNDTPLTAKLFIETVLPRQASILFEHMFGHDALIGIMNSKLSQRESSYSKIGAIAIAFAYYRVHKKELLSNGDFLSEDFSFDEAQWKIKLQSLPGAKDYFSTDMAIHALRETLTLKPELLAPRLRLADILHGEGNEGEAESLLNEALSIPSNDYWGLLLKCKIAIKLKKFDKALEFARKSFELHSDIITIGYLAQLLYHNELLDEAVMFINTQLSIRPDWLRGISLRYLCYTKLKLFDKALDDAIVLFNIKKDTSNYERLIKSLYNIKNFEEARSVFIEGINKFGSLNISPKIVKYLNTI